MLFRSRTGQVAVVDLTDDRVAARLDLTPAGNRLQLLAKDGVVFYNDLDGNAVGVLRFDGRTWVAGAALSKFDPADGAPVAAVPDPPAADQPVPERPAATPDAAPPAAPATPPARDPAAPPGAAPTRPPDRAGGTAPPAPGAGTPTAGSPTPGTPAPVTVQVEVTGDGRVTSSPPGVSCPGTCAAAFAPGTQVTLTATPGGTSTAGPWSGACRDVAAGASCRVVAQGAVTAGVAFTPPPGRVTVVVTVVGAGAVQSDPPGLACDRASSPCTAQLPDDVPLLLTAIADPGAEGGVWSGDCSERHCELPAGAGGDVTATFVTQRLLTVDEPTGGRITGPGIDCPGDCDEWFPEGDVVSLGVTQHEDARFVAWAQDCSGTATTCDLTVDADPVVAATFEAYPIGPFVGDWRADGSTARAVVVATGPTTATIEFWGACHPTGCPWGQESATLLDGGLFAVFDFEHRPEVDWDTRTTLRREGGLLRATHVDTFHDGRPDRGYEHVLER